MKSEKVKIQNCIIAVIGSSILSFGLYNIHSFCEITEGGVLGLILLLRYWFDISPSLSSFIMNVFCYTTGWKTLGKNFLIYSGVSTIGFSLTYKFFEQFEPIFPQLKNMPLFSSILGAIFVGIGAGICVKAGGAPSGDDALAMSLSHIFKVKIQWIYLISDLFVLFMSLSYIPFNKILYSLLSVVISGQIIGFIQNLSRKKKI